MDLDKVPLAPLGKFTQESLDKAARELNKERREAERLHNQSKQLMYDHAGRIFREFLKRTAVAKVDFNPTSLRLFEKQSCYIANAIMEDSVLDIATTPCFDEWLEAICEDAVNEVCPGIRFEFEFNYSGPQVVIHIPMKQIV